MPQLDYTTFPSQLFWLLVTFAVLYVLMRWLALPRLGRVIDNRRQRLEADLARATELKVQAETVLADYQKALATARDEAQATLRQASERLAAEAAERQRVLAETLAQQIAAAERRVAEAKEEALGEIRAIAVEIGGAAVEKLTGTAPDAARLAAAVDTALGARTA